MKRFLIATVAAATLLANAAAITPARADNGRHNDHGWGQGRDWDRGNHGNNNGRVVYYYPRTYYAPPRDRVVYVQPQHYYYGSDPYYSQSFASPTTTTTTYYPDGGYTTSYTVGGYLPSSRVWHPMPDYVRYGLRAPGRGERWVGSGRDAVLITEATSRILSGVLLAASIN